MQTSITVLTIIAAVTATRSQRSARWPLWAAGSIALLPFVMLPVARATSGINVAALLAAQTEAVSWPVAWALFLGWFFRASRRQAPAARSRKRRP